MSIDSMQIYNNQLFKDGALLYPQGLTDNIIGQIIGKFSKN